jgi:hypothetical protein
MIGKYFIVLICLFVTACASTEMKGYVGSSISEAFISYGKPEAVFDLPDGRRAFQFRWGGGTAVLPGRSNTYISGSDATGYNVTTVGTPAMAFESEGCLITFIASRRGNDFIVDEYRVPKRMVC